MSLTMANMLCRSPLLIALILLLNRYVVNADAQRKIYIVLMGEQPKGGLISMESIHMNVLEQILEGSSSAKESLIYSYGKSFNGFAARLTEHEQKKLAGMKGVATVFPSRKLKLHTTRSWDFLNFPTTVKRLPAVESDIVVGMIDSGIWPESESFNDKGMGPPPSKWKGVCQNIKCNNKIIGARFYMSNQDFSPDQNFSPEEEKSPRDIVGHGTHTASTVAGREVGNKSLYGLAAGTVRGAVPSARIAVYKVCWNLECDDADILAAFDDAIDDGVDILSVSIGGAKNFYYTDSIAIGAFHAMRKGILTSASAGNDGPTLGTVGNVAPWVLTVAASTTDRSIINNVTLGNGKTISGHAISTFPTNKTFFPLISGTTTENERFCLNTEQNEILVDGKIIFCPFFSDGSGPFLSGAQGAVIVSNQFNDFALSFPLSATVLSIDNGDKIMSYVNKTSNPTANIQKSEAVLDPNASYIVSFSSRGPNGVSPGILKPDISAPGVDILAAWSPKGTVSSFSGDKRSVEYNIVSGTSMACPHATGAAVYVKTFHPNWSPAAIKSALMTTATRMKTINRTEYEFAYGAGQIDPVKAVNPGLVYDLQESDYIQLLCNTGFTKGMIRTITQQNITCGKSNGTEASLNYPSMTDSIASDKPFNTNFPRTVTNVGLANSTYKVTISPHPLLNITVTPSMLSFKSLNEKLNFVVNIAGGTLQRDSVITTWLSWSDGIHNVRSPIVVWRASAF